MLDQQEYTDQSLMPFGQYKGEKLTNIPGSYLLYCLDKGFARGNLKKYIEQNIDILTQGKK